MQFHSDERLNILASNFCLFLDIGEPFTILFFSSGILASNEQGGKIIYPSRLFGRAACAVKVEISFQLGKQMGKKE
jgi:hypothetical protein